jgi:tripartite-type tricarboxylate transporter receptor subunit TctC
MEVNPSFPAKAVPEFIAYPKANPGKINFGSAGTGTSIHVASELFKMKAGVDMVHVPYRGGATAVADLLAHGRDARQRTQSPGPDVLDRVRRGLFIRASQRRAIHQ